MATEIAMPKMGYDMTEGKLLRWFKHEGDTVAKGEAVAEIETDKVAIEVEAFDAGVLRQIQVQEGETVAVGTRLALLAAPGEELPPAATVRTPEAAAASAGATASTAQTAEEQPAQAQRTATLNASPLARRVAQERGVDLSTVQGTGPGGRITREDVLAVADQAAAGAPAPQPASTAASEAGASSTARADEKILTRLQQTIGRRMVESKTHAPHFYVTMHADMTEAMALRKQLNARLEEDARISVNDLIVKAAVQALAAFPTLNATFAGDRLTLYQEIAICVAVALEEGLVTPVVHHAEQKTLKQIARETRSLVERTRSGRNRAEDYEGGSFTVSNLGMFDVDTFVAIINPPQAAILAVGAVQRLPVYVGDDVLPRSLISMTLSADHRVTDGATAARFLAHMRDDLEHPVQLLA